MDKFNFFAQEVNTFLPYDRESHYISELFAEQDNQNEQGVAFIMQSMTENQKKIIKLIAEEQLKDSGKDGVDYYWLVDECVRKTICLSLKHVKDLLGEAKSHQLIKERQNDEGKVFVFISQKAHIIKKIVDDKWDTS